MNGNDRIFNALVNNLSHLAPEERHARLIRAHEHYPKTVRPAYRDFQVLEKFEREQGLPISPWKP